MPSDAVDAGRVRTRAVESEADGARRPAAVAASGSRYMEIVTLVQTDFYICGLGGVVLRVDDGGVAHRDLLLLAYVCEPQDEERYGPGGAPPGESQRPELRVLSRHNQAPPPFPLYPILDSPIVSLALPPPLRSSRATRSRSEASSR